MRAFLILSLLLIVSCSDTDTGVEPDPNSNGSGNGSIDSSGFAILGVTKDTLYSGEAAWIDVNELGTDVEALRLFVHSVEADDMEIIGNRLHFTIPRNTQTGKVRLYKHDTLLAKNNFTLHVLPKYIHDIHITFGEIIPAEGYPGDVIYLYASDFPLRRKDFDFMLGDSILKVIEWSSNPVRLLVPEGKGKMMLKMRFLEAVSDIQMFEILSQEGEFLKDYGVGQFLINTSLLGQMKIDVTEPDSSYTIDVEGINLQIGALLQEQAKIERSDSVYLRANSKTSNEEATVDIALIPAIGKNTVSGRITISYRNSMGLPTESFQTVTAIVKDMSWKKSASTNGWYVIYERGEAIADKLVSITSQWSYGADHGEEYIMRTITYTGADLNSDFRLMLGG